MISYEGLEKALKEKGIGKTELSTELGLSTRTVAKIAKGEKLSKRSIHRIAEYLGESTDVIMKEISDNRILQILREEKDMKLSGGLYHELQVRMTYNSNHIEGSRLSEEQTRLIFETNTLDVGDGIQVDDVLETVHHFRAIDYVIDVAEDELTEDIIKYFHYILKHDTKDSTLEWFAVGDYKKRANVVGGRKTTSPSEVSNHMKSLLHEYNSMENVDIEEHLDLKFRTKNSEIVSYFEYKFSDEIISDIVLGPTSRVNINQLTLFLSQYLPSLKISKILKSKIPLTY